MVERPIHIHLTPRERDTVIAALRYYQAANDWDVPSVIEEIAANDHDSPLDSDEIENLIQEHVNVGPEPLQST